MPNDAVIIDSIPSLGRTASTWMPDILCVDLDRAVSSASTEFVADKESYNFPQNAAARGYVTTASVPGARVVKSHPTSLTSHSVVMSDDIAGLWALADDDAPSSVCLVNLPTGQLLTDWVVYERSMTRPAPYVALYGEIKHGLEIPLHRIEARKETKAKGRAALYEELKALRSHGRALYARIVELEEQMREEEDGFDGIREASIAGFLRFLRATPKVALPALTVTDDYNLYATWRKPDGRVFSLHFLSESEARYVIFRPSPVAEGHKLRSSGTIPTSLALNVPETASAVWAFA